MPKGPFASGSTEAAFSDKRMSPTVKAAGQRYKAETPNPVRVSQAHTGGDRKTPDEMGELFSHKPNPCGV